MWRLFCCCNWFLWKPTALILLSYNFIFKTLSFFGLSILRKVFPLVTAWNSFHPSFDTRVLWPCLYRHLCTIIDHLLFHFTFLSFLESNFTGLFLVHYELFMLLQCKLLYFSWTVRESMWNGKGNSRGREREREWKRASALWSTKVAHAMERDKGDQRGNQRKREIEGVRTLWLLSRVLASA